MFRNYLKTGFRNLIKNKLSSLINLGGLAIAVGCCLMSFSFIDWSTHRDGFHSRIDRLFVIERIGDKNGAQQLYGNSPAPLGPLLKKDFPEIHDMTRFSDKDVLIKQGENVFRENISFIDPSFYSMFDFPVKWGNKKDFTDQDAIVLTDDLSQSLFGKENPMGKKVSVLFTINGKESTENFIVKGVLEKLGSKTSFYFSALAPYSRMTALSLNKPGDWTEHAAITFLEVGKSASLNTVLERSKKYLTLYNAANKETKTLSFFFQPLKTMNSHAYLEENSHFDGNDPTGMIMLLVIGVAILLMVYFNYMNISVASASTRLKEISVRKVMGSMRKEIILQFITENLILCTCAVSIGVALAALIFLPWFSTISSVDLAHELFSSPRTWIILLALILLSAIGGSAYPAVYISAFNPSALLRGSVQTGNKNRFRKVLLSFQFFLMFISISLAIAFVNETKQVKTKPWGYIPDNNLGVHLDNTSNFKVFETALNNNIKISSITGAEQPMGAYTKQITIKENGKSLSFKSMNILPGYLSQFKMAMISGRDFNKNLSMDTSNSVIVNQAFLKQMKWTSGIGGSITYNDRKYTVIGVVSDFHYEDFQHPVDPLILMDCPVEKVHYAYIKTPALFSGGIEADVKRVWQKINPQLPFDSFHQDLVFNNYYRMFDQISEVLGGTSIIMTIISISGIFGLALIILDRKMKEISIRKVIGAGLKTIILLINKEFMYALGVAVLIGIPISYFLTGLLLHLISTESKVSFIPLLLSLITLILTTALSVVWHIQKAHTSNPTKYLKNE